MRPLTKSENRLLSVFAFLTFLVVNFIGLPALWRHQESLGKDLDHLRAERLSARSWLAEKELWGKRAEWLDSKQPKFTNPGEASSALLESLQKTARAHQINIVEQNFVEGSTHPSYQEVGVKLKVTGSLEMIVRWLTEIQQPELFQVVRDFSLKSGAEPPIVNCSLQVERWYASK